MISVQPFIRKMATSSSTSVIQSAKKALRKEMKRKIACLSAQEKASQSMLVTKKVLAMPEYVKATSVALFLSMPDEIETSAILKHALASKTVYIPRYFTGGNHMEMVQLYDMDDYSSLPLTKWNIKQPKDDEARPEALDHGLDLMLVPGLAFTLSGSRLGRGAGYYDTYLSKAAEKSIRPLTVALAFREQIVTEIPVSDHDFFIDRVAYS